MKKTFCTFLLIAAMIFCSVVNTAAAVNQNDAGVVPLAAEQSPEYNSKYDVKYVWTEHGWAERIYQIGTLFNLFRSRALTETWGDDSAVADLSAYAYAKIENVNTGEKEEHSNSKVDSNRYCDACTDYIGANHATHLSHKSTLKVKGVSQWTNDEGTVNFPG